MKISGLLTFMISYVCLEILFMREHFPAVFTGKLFGLFTITVGVHVSSQIPVLGELHTADFTFEWLLSGVGS